MWNIFCPQVTFSPTFDHVLRHIFMYILAFLFCVHVWMYMCTVLEDIEIAS